MKKVKRIVNRLLLLTLLSGTIGSPLSAVVHATDVQNQVAETQVSSTEQVSEQQSEEVVQKDTGTELNKTVDSSTLESVESQQKATSSSESVPEETEQSKSKTESSKEEKKVVKTVLSRSA